MTGPPSGTASTTIPPRSGDIPVGQKSNRHPALANGESSKVPVNSGITFQERQQLLRNNALSRHNIAFPQHNNGGLFAAQLRMRGVRFPSLPINLSHNCDAQEQAQLPFSH